MQLILHLIICILDPADASPAAFESLHSIRAQSLSETVTETIRHSIYPLLNAEVYRAHGWQRTLLLHLAHPSQRSCKKTKSCTMHIASIFKQPKNPALWFLLAAIVTTDKVSWMQQLP